MIPDKSDIREAIVLADKSGYAIPQVIKDLTVSYLKGELVEKSQEIAPLTLMTLKERTEWLYTTNENARYREALEKLAKCGITYKEISEIATAALSPEAEKCPVCDGDGKGNMSAGKCGVCNGTGKRKEE